MVGLYVLVESWTVPWHFFLMQLGAGGACLLYLYSRRARWYHTMLLCLAVQCVYLPYMLSVGLPLLINIDVCRVRWLREDQYAYFVSTHGGDPNSSFEAYEHFRMMERSVGSRKSL